MFSKILATILAIVATTTCHAAVCTHNMSQQADSMLSQLNNWKSVEKYYVQYKQCDNGYLAESSADSISYLIAEHWKSLPEVNAIIRRKGPRFERFVLNHISEIIGQERLHRLKDLSSNDCPIHLETLCLKINKEASNADRAFYE